MQGALAWGYVAVTLGYLAAAGWHAWALAGLAREAPARWLARVTWGLHTLLLAWQVAHGTIPFLSSQGSVFFLSWAWVLNGLVLESLLALRPLGAFMLPPVVILLVLVAAGAVPPPGAIPAGGVVPGSPPAAGWPESGGVPGPGAGPGPGGGLGPAAGAGLAGGFVPPGATGLLSPGAAGLLSSSPWVWLHAVIALLSYGAFGLASALAAMYLLQERQLRVKVFSRLYRHLPALEDMDRACWWLVGSGFALLTLALASGSLQAGRVWGAAWARDGKVLASAGVWLFYAACLALRAVAGWRGRRQAYLSLLGFAVILLNYLVVGPHWSARHDF